MAIYENAEEDAHAGSFGWWVFPDGEVDEMCEMGGHGQAAHSWLCDQVGGYPGEDFDEAIEALRTRGGIRVSTFHGTVDMNIDFAPHLVTAPAKEAMLGLMKEQRPEFSRYWFETGSPQPSAVRYAKAIAKMQGVVPAGAPQDPEPPSPGRR